MLLKAMKTNLLLPVMHKLKICGGIKLLFYLKLFSEQYRGNLERHPS